MDTNYNPFSLQGKTILVTGASSGIGKGIAIECSKLNASVILSARNEDRIKQTLEACGGNTNSYILADLTIQKDIENIISSVPNLDGVVLCAGRSLVSPFNFASRDKFNTIFDINFFGPIELIRLLSKKKKLNNNASVVFVASIGGLTTFANGSSMYGASKAALNAIMHYCAREFSSKLIRVNSVCPGMIETPLIFGGSVTEEQYEEDKKKLPLKRYGRPEDVAHGVAYLLSDASSWVTAHSLIIDGGRSTL